VLTLLTVLLVLAVLAIAGLVTAGATWVRERDEWQTYGLSVQEELADRAEAGQ
jgi:hypothetical protein